MRPTKPFEVQRSESSSDLPAGCRQRWVPAGLCYLEGSQQRVLSPHHRITRTRRCRGPGKLPGALLATECQHAPVNDSSFMKKE